MEIYDTQKAFQLTLNAIKSFLACTGYKDLASCLPSQPVDISDRNLKKCDEALVNISNVLNSLPKKDTKETPKNKNSMRNFLDLCNTVHPTPSEVYNAKERPLHYKPGYTVEDIPQKQFFRLICSETHRGSGSNLIIIHSFTDRAKWYKIPFFFCVENSNKDYLLEESALSVEKIQELKDAPIFKTPWMITTEKNLLTSSSSSNSESTFFPGQTPSSFGEDILKSDNYEKTSPVFGCQNRSPTSQKDASLSPPSFGFSSSEAGMESLSKRNDLMRDSHMRDSCTKRNPFNISNMEKSQSFRNLGENQECFLEAPDQQLYNANIKEGAEREVGKCYEVHQQYITWRENKRKEWLKRLNFIKIPSLNDQHYSLENEEGESVNCFNLKILHTRTTVTSDKMSSLTPKVGDIIAGRYVIEELFCKTLASKTFRCHDKILDCYVCLKIIENKKSFFNESLREIEILRYLQINGDLKQIHCVTLYDFFYYNEHLMLVFELLCEDLYKLNKRCLISQKPYFTIGRIQRIAFQTLNALQYIHSLFLIHCDLKPENILIDSLDPCDIKIIDFGSCCFADDVLPAIVQTRYYRSPEVILGLPYDEKIDLWSLGCILFELWTGYPLFQCSDAAALLSRIIAIFGPLPNTLIEKSQFTVDVFLRCCSDVNTLKPYSTVHSLPKKCYNVSIFRPEKINLNKLLHSKDTEFVMFLEFLLQVDPLKRPTASYALKHEWLQSGRYIDGL